MKVHGKKLWRALAPSNIALIKYMGKTDHSGNRPTNSSLSYTLSHLQSIVEVEASSAGVSGDAWEPLLNFDDRSLAPLDLAGKGRERFLAHFARLKKNFGVDGSFVLRSANDFPSDCGLASSASSFAALTRAALSAFTDLRQTDLPSETEAADLSRQGSGSSCRSFFTPWSIWDERGARAVTELEGLRFLHQVIVVDDTKKAVSSSEAHRRVASSELFAGRPERAEKRVKDLISALTVVACAASREDESARDAWRQAFEITWAEFWDMHALFETSRPSFGYMTEGSLAALRFVRSESWDQTGTGPLVTMDAGPNVHLLHRSDVSGRAFAQQVSRALEGRFRVISENFDGQKGF